MKVRRRSTANLQAVLVSDLRSVSRAEKDLLLQFKDSVISNLGPAVHCDESSRKRSLRWYGATGVVMEQWEASRSTCSFRGVDCYDDGHVKRMYDSEDLPLRSRCTQHAQRLLTCRCICID